MALCSDVQRHGDSHGATDYGGNDSAMADAVEHKGWLQKQGHVNKDFKRRYFVLKGAKLSYYEDVAGYNRNKSKGSVTVTRVGHLKTPNDAIGPETVPLAFRFDTAEKKPFTVYADDLKAKHGWLVALVRATREASKEAKPIEELYQEEVAGGEGAWECLSKGLALARKGEKAAARAEFEATLVRSDYVEAMTRLEPCCLCTLYELGKALCDAGEYSEALKRFTSALLMAPPEAAQQLRLQSAWCMWRLGRSDEAQQLYWQVLDDDALCWQALLDRSRMHLALGSWASALVDLQLVIGLGQQSAEVYNDRGVCSYETGAFDRALEDFNQAIELNPSYAQAYTNRGNCLRKQAKTAQAADDYTKAIELDPKNPKSYNNRGALHLKTGKYADALSDFSEAVRLDPKYEVAVRNQQIAQQRVADVEVGVNARRDSIAKRASQAAGGNRDSVAASSAKSG